MKVILKKAVPKLGKEGQVVTVKDGYARNFLFPQSLAIIADKRQLEVLGRQNAKKSAELAATKATAESKRDQFNGKTIKIGAKVGKDAGKLFGAITAQDIADALKSQLKFEVDKRDVLVLQPIKRLGVESVEIDIHPQVDIRVNVVVFDVEHPESAAEVAETVAEEPVAVEA